MSSIGTPFRMGTLRIAVACLLGVATALLVSCGSSGKSLIPAADAGPLRNYFQAVEDAAHAGNGNCRATEEAILKAERALGALPASVDPGLHERLEEGLKNQREHALELCAQPLSPATATTTSPRTTTSTTTTPTTPTVTQTTTTPSTPTTTPTTSTPGGGTPAPGPGGGEAPPTPGSEQGGAKANEGTGHDGGPPGGGGAGGGAGGQEGGK